MVTLLSIINLSFAMLPIQRAAHTTPATVEDMSVDHGGFDILVAEQFLHGADIVTIFQQMGGEGVAKGVAGGVFVNIGGTNGGLYGFLQDAFVNMMAAPLAAPWINQWKRGWQGTCIARSRPAAH